MANKINKQTEFSEKRVSDKEVRVRKGSFKKFFDDEISYNRGRGNAVSNAAVKIEKSEEIRGLFQNALKGQLNGNQIKKLVDTSENLFATNPLYQTLVKYFANIFMWRYKIIPHRVYVNSKTKITKTPKELDFNLIYREMLEVVDGMSIETLYPLLLTKLYTDGAVYFTTIADVDKHTLTTITLPTKYCRKIAQTQFGTGMIQFDYSYFKTLKLGSDADTRNYIKAEWGPEFEKGYSKYLENNQFYRWQELDPRYSTCIMMNDYGIPTMLYGLGAIINYEQYNDNELERNSNLLKYLVVQTMPHYENDLIFTIDEVQDLHKSLRNKIEVNDNASLITTWGDVHVESISDTESSDSDVLKKAFASIFNNVGLNSTLFTGDSVEAMRLAILKDKSNVWEYVQQITNFYIIAINNWWAWKDYEADIEILPISVYTYNDDIEIFKNNATLGVNKLDYFIASGTKQKNIQDQLFLEDFLGLENIQPMRTSYTLSDKSQDSDAEDTITEEKTNNNQEDSITEDEEPTNNEQ